mgnify:CR=1 FL=1
MLTQLLAQAKLGAYLTIALDVGLFKIVLKAAAAADHLEQATAGMVVVLVLLEVLVQVVDALSQQSDLYLGGTGVALVNRVLGEISALVIFTSSIFFINRRKPSIALGDAENTAPGSRSFYFTTASMRCK